MFRRTAILDNNNFVIDIVYNDEDIPQGATSIRIPKNQICEKGFNFTGQTFTDSKGNENFKMAVVDQNGTVVNMIVGNENSPTEANTTLVKVSENQLCGIGFSFSGGKFFDSNGMEQLYS